MSQNVNILRNGFLFVVTVKMSNRKLIEMLLQQLFLFDISLEMIKLCIYQCSRNSITAQKLANNDPPQPFGIVKHSMTDKIFLQDIVLILTKFKLNVVRDVHFIMNLLLKGLKRNTSNELIVDDTS